MEDQEFKTNESFVALSEAYWKDIVTVKHLHKSAGKHNDVVSTTMDRWIELMVKANLIKQYQAETLRLLASVPEIPIGYYHRPQKFSLLSQSRCEGKTTTVLCDEPIVSPERKFPEFDPCINGYRIFLSPVLEFNTPNRNGRVYKHFSCRNVLSMEKRRKLGL